MAELGRWMIGRSMASHRGKQQFWSVLFAWLIAVATAGAAVAEESLAERLQRSAEILQRLSQDAKQGNPVSQYLLGLRYLVGGDGVPQDYAEAAKWFHHAANQGVPTAQEQLGDMYVLGQGVPKDFVRAHMWLNLAGTRGLLGRSREQEIRQKRDELARQMTAAQIAEAQRLAREWKPKPER